MEFTKWYEKMIEAYADDLDALELIQMSVVAMADYVREVFVFETRMPVLTKTGQYNGDELRREKEQLDQNRHDAHECAISGIKRLNHLAELKNLPLAFSGDVSNRYDIADFCAACVAEVFSKRIR